MDKLYLLMNLQFFNDDKTELPTEKKKKKAREEGQVAKSQEIGTAIILIASFIAVRNAASVLYTKLLEIFEHNFRISSEIDDIFVSDYIIKYGTQVFIQVFLLCLPIFGLIMIAGLVVNIVQVGWSPTTKPLKPNFKKLNPLSGFKKLFSPKSFIELAKSLAKMAVIVYCIYGTLNEQKYLLFQIIHMELFEATVTLGTVIIDMGINVGVTYLIIGLLDFAYQKFKHSKDMRMSKQEIKDEYKEAEGNPIIKSAIKQKMREASMRRMMQDVGSADVIITNPTHYAIALRYDKDKDTAPIVVAKGIDFMAKRIKEKAKENKVEIIENKPLARALYATCDIGKIIPPELYQSVAEILAFVYKLKNVV